MSKNDLSHPLEPALWGEAPFHARSRECTPLYLTRFVGPRRSARRTAHDHWELTVVLAGEGVLRVESGRYRLRPGTVMLVPPGRPHREEAEDALDTIWIGCRGARFRALVRRPRGVRNPDLAAELERLWLLAHQAGGRHGPELDARLLLALVELFREPAAGVSGGADDLIEQALRFMHARLSEPLSLTQLARRAGCSPGHFGRLFRRRTGHSAMQWLARARIQQAAHLLRNTGLTVSEIAARVGVPNLFYFSRLFKKRMNETPRRYRRRGGGSTGAGAARRLTGRTPPG